LYFGLHAIIQIPRTNHFGRKVTIERRRREHHPSEANPIHEIVINGRSRPPPSEKYIYMHCPIFNLRSLLRNHVSIMLHPKRHITGKIARFRLALIAIYYVF
jgi:hypothetical protein